MDVRTCSRIALALALAVGGCATTYDTDKPVYQGKEYRTGSNIPVHDGDMRGTSTVAKPDDTPATTAPWQYKKGPGGANY